MTLEKLHELLKKCWSRETSSDPENWTAENPAWGQCAITALIVHDFLGGELVRGDAIINSKPISHYWNRLPNIGDVDLTRNQFPQSTEISERMIRPKDYILGYEPTRKRYDLLKLALKNLMAEADNDS